VGGINPHPQKPRKHSRTGFTLGRPLFQGVRKFFTQGLLGIFGTTTPLFSLGLHLGGVQGGFFQEIPGVTGPGSVVIFPRASVKTRVPAGGTPVEFSPPGVKIFPAGGTFVTGGDHLSTSRICLSHPNSAKILPGVFPPKSGGLFRERSCISPSGGGPSL